MTSTEEQSCLQSAGAESGRIVGPIYYHKKFKQRVGQPAWALDEVTAPSSGDQSAAVEPVPSPSTERRPSADEEDGHEEGAPGGSTAAGPPSLSPCSVGDEACVATVRRSTAAAGRYQCSFCGNFFAKPSVLDKHIRSHTNERPFSCSVCNYSFKTKSNFVKHCKTRKHTARCAGADVDSDEDDDEEPAPSDSDLSDQAEDMDVSWMLARDRPPRTGRALSHSIESIMGRQPPRTRSTSPIVKGVVSHIDKVIELNEAQLSGTRRALDSFGRHSSTLGREREAVRRGSLSSSNSTLDSSEGLTADLCPPPALMRSQSLCASSSGDMTHVLKRHLLSGVNHELAEASSVSKRRRLSIQDSALAVHDAALSAGAPEEHRGRICNSLTGGQMHVYGEAERRASRETQQRAAGGSMSMFVDSRAAHHSYPPSPHIMTIKSNLNSGGKMIEVAGSDAAASGSSISQDNTPAVGLTTMTSSGDSDRSSLDIASNTGCNSAILQHPGTYTTAVSDYIRLAGGDESAAAGTRRAVSTAILHTEINSGKLAASGAIDSDGASSSSNSAGCEDDNRPIDLTVRADPTAAAVQQPSTVLSVMNCTEQLTRMYSNLQRISQLVAPSAAAAPPPTATSSRVDKPPPLTPISLSLSSAAIRGGSPVASAVNSPAPSGGQRSSQVQSPRSVVSLLAISSPSGEAAAATPAPTAGPPASCPPPAPTAVAAPFSCPAPPENNMQAVLNDIFNQVRTERASAGMATAGKSGADGPPVADSPTPSTTLSAPSPAAGQQLMHPNVTAGQPGLALTRPGPRSADAEPLQHTDSSFFYRNSDRLVCSVCNKQDFVNRNQLSAHQKTHQMDQRRFRCSVCEIGFRSEQQLAKHRRTNEHMQKSVMLEKFGGKAQTDRRIYECLFCQRGFHNVGTLHKHFRCKTHVMGLENAGWLPCGVYAELESSGISARTDGPESINVDCTWQNYCHLQELSLALLHDRPAEMSDWRVKFEQIRRGSPPKHYPFEIDSKLRGNTDSSRPRPQFPDDFRGPQLKLEAADSVANLSVQGCQSGLPVQ